MGSSQSDPGDIPSSNELIVGASPRFPDAGGRLQSPLFRWRVLREMGIPLTRPRHFSPFIFLPLLAIRGQKATIFTPADCQKTNLLTEKIVRRPIRRSPVEWRFLPATSFSHIVSMERGKADFPRTNITSPTL